MQYAKVHVKFQGIVAEQATLTVAVLNMQVNVKRKMEVSA